MKIRRPLAALFTALTLFGGGATLTACEAAGQDTNDGTTDDTGDQSGGSQTEDGGSDGDGDQSNQEPGDEDDSNDQQDPD